jgi:hypothetical protein
MTQRRIEVEWSDGLEIQRADLADARHVRFEQAHPIRLPNSYRGQISMPGDYFLDVTGTHVPYESRLERTALLERNFDPTVVAISAQPFRLHMTVAGKRRKQTPDFFVRRMDDSGEVVNVKGVLRAAEPEVRQVFEAVRDACRSVGWRHTVATEVDPVRLANLEFLSGYRTPLPTEEGLIEHILEEASASIALGGLLEVIGSADARPAVFSLLWHQLLNVDLSHPLSLASSVVTTHKEVESP